MNDVNLNAFQYDFDLTWMSFFQNAEGRTYARYGGREDSGPETHLTKASLMKTMQRVVALHKADAAKPWSKYEPQPLTRFTPGEIPPMKKMLAKRKVSCIHCHDVKNATLYDLQDQGLLKKDHVYTYPSPRQLGIIVDPDDQSHVKIVVANSAAQQAGIKTNDTIVSAAGQRIVTFADFARVLELAPDTGNVNVTVSRGATTKTNRTVQIPLTTGWRRSPDPSWRASTSVVGPNSGFWANQLGQSAMKNLKLNKDELALKVVVVWGAWAKKAGIKNGDVIVKIDGKEKSMSIRQLQTHLQMNHEFGDTVKLTVNRKGRNQELTMQLPKSGERH